MFENMVSTLERSGSLSWLCGSMRRRGTPNFVWEINRHRHRWRPDTQYLHPLCDWHMYRQCVHRYQRRRTRQILWFACNRSQRRGFEAGSKLTPPYHMAQVKPRRAPLFCRLLTIGKSHDGACCLSMDPNATVSGVNAAACERHCRLYAGTGGSASPIQKRHSHVSTAPWSCHQSLPL